MISMHSKVLQSLTIQIEVEQKFSRSFRPPSPVKMLSSFLNGGNSLSSGSGSKMPKTPVLTNIPSMQPSGLLGNINKKDLHVKTEAKAGRSVRANTIERQPVNQIVRLEETFASYIAALQVRKGNVVGKVLRGRVGADELAVNDLYNAAIANPFENRIVNEVSIDVLFVAFEKFLRIAWKDQMGAVVSFDTLINLQEKALKLFPGDFADYCNFIFGEMAPQNRRGFIAIVKLLADLLDGSSNDGDRGALTAAFAELLVVEGNPHDFISLLDRMVEDSDRLFDDQALSGRPVTPAYGSINSTTRSIRSANNGSLTPNTSLRKRFGFETLMRQNSKAESETRPSVWRQLSKTTRNQATPDGSEPVLTRPTLLLGRSNSIDAGVALNRRPTSRDRPTLLGAFDERPSSSHMQQFRLSTIGASPPPQADNSAKPSKKKRRSSLSDLKTLLAAATLSDDPAEKHSTPPTQQPSQAATKNLDSSPRTPSPSKIPLQSMLFSNVSPFQKKETSPMSPKSVGNLTERLQNAMMTDNNVVVKDLWSARRGHSKSVSVSAIPTLGGTPVDRRPSIPTLPSKAILSPSMVTTKGLGSPLKPAPASPQKLRLQSPQKLRQRMQADLKTAEASQSSIQAEIDKISAEMARVDVRSPTRMKSPIAMTNDNNNNVQSQLDTLRASLASLQSRIHASQPTDNALIADMLATLTASETKVRGLDQLYKESSAENELLYERLHAELAKILRLLKGKGEKEDLLKKMTEAVEEARGVRKENARLRREVVGLRAQVKGLGGEAREREKGNEEAKA